MRPASLKSPKTLALVVFVGAAWLSVGALAFLLKGSERGSERGGPSRPYVASPLPVGGERAAADEEGSPDGALASAHASDHGGDRGDRGRTVVVGDGDGTLLVLGSDEAPDVLSGRELVVWSGRVIEARSGRAVSGANVALNHPAHVARAATDEDGRFELSWYEDLPAELVVKHPAYVDLRAPPAAIELIGERDELVLVRSGVIVGSLLPLPAGFDPARAEVHLWLADRRARTAKELSARFDAQGRFRLGDLDPGHYNLAAYVPGETIALKLGLLVKSGDVREVVLRPSRGAVLEGRVLERATDAPVAGAELTARFERIEVPRHAADAYRRTGSTDQDGRYRIEGLAPGRWRMVIGLPWGGRARGTFDVAESGARIEQDFHVPGPARVAGSVIADGAGVAGARVYGLLGRDLAGLRRLMRDGELEDAPAATTDAHGRFRIEGLPSEERLVLVAFPDRNAIPPGLLEVRPISPGEEISG
ncbi:MAG: hypothetical protein O7B99_13525, partial [Planctomycetota bacterium]|nr:hypothetical protein [Planctomycetota bacterium]